ncbi:hypothetical protein [Streptomyces vinaceus]|uniref:hypothetical protein n=1 Tax=Streptomyces vinaceus TaxID=1960 RepID=UPI003688179E
MNDHAGPVLLLNPPRTTTAELLAQAAAWRGHDVVLRAAGPLHRVADRDRPFRRAAVSGG